MPDRLLTVALPTYNGARHLADALASVLVQQGVEFDLLISDDSSDDESVAIARQVAGNRGRIVRQTQRLGLAGNWNACVEQSRTHWVTIFHQDDMMRPGHLAGLLDSIQRRPDLGMICTSADVIDEHGVDVPTSVVAWPLVRDADRVFEPGDFVRELAVHNPVRCATVCLNRQAHAKLGGFDGGLRYALDWAFWLEVAKRYPVAWRAEPTVRVRWHLRSETHRFQTGTVDLEEQERVTNDALAWLQSHGSSEVRTLRKARDQRVARAYLNRAYTAARAGDRALETDCLRRVWSLAPSQILGVLSQPRLAARLMLGRARSGVVNPEKPQ